MGVGMNTRIRIAAAYSTLTKTEKRIADDLLTYRDVRHLSLADLSKKLGVGEASIVRFCRKLGYRGYQDFRFSLALDEANE